jgi:hypothetical protein
MRANNPATSKIAQNSSYIVAPRQSPGETIARSDATNPSRLAA